MAGLVVAGCEQTPREITGVVVDCRNEAVVPGATLRLVGWKDYRVTTGPVHEYKGITEREGRFHIAHDPPIDHLEAVAPGYRTAHVQDLQGLRRVRLLPGDSQQVSYGCRPAEQCLQTRRGTDGTVEIRNACLEDGS